MTPAERDAEAKKAGFRNWAEMEAWYNKNRKTVRKVNTSIAPKTENWLRTLFSDPGRAMRQIIPQSMGIQAASDALKGANERNK